MKKNLLIAGGAVALVMSTGSLALAAGATSPQGGGVSARAAKLAPVVIACNGGASKGLQTRIVNSPFTFNETAVNDQDQAVPGATVTLFGPAVGTDTLLVTYSAETQITGGDASDWMGLEVHDNGVPINPFTPGADKLAITGEPSWNSNSAQFCVKIRSGVHRLQVFSNLHDSNGGHSLHGWLDDYTLSVLRSGVDASALADEPRPGPTTAGSCPLTCPWRARRRACPGTGSSA